MFALLTEYYGWTATLASVIAILWYVAIPPLMRRTAGKKLPPTLPWLPIIGSVPFMTDMGDNPPFYFNKLQKKLGNVFAFYSGSRYMVVLNKADDIREALVKKASIFSDRAPLYTENHILNVNQKGLAFRPYDKLFKKYHQLGLAILKQLGFGSQVMEGRIQVEVKDIINKFKAIRGEPFCPESHLIQGTMNIMVGMLFGQRFDDEHLNELNKLYQSVNGWFLGQMNELELFPLLRYLPLYKRKIRQLAQHNQGMLDAIDSSIRATIAGERDTNFASLFMEMEGPDYDSEELRFLMRDFLLGGTETVAIQTQWFLVMLANHPEIQARLQKEIDAVVPRSRLPSMDDRAEMPYGEAAILEIMRCKVVGPMSLMHASNRDSQVAGYHIPANSTVITCLYNTLLDSDVFPDPEKFKPERFLDESGNVICRDSIIPFGVGKRSCPGESLARQSAFLFATALIQNFDVRPIEGKGKVEYEDRVILNWFPVNYQLRLIERGGGVSTNDATKI